jgi:hypothetical protein
MCMSNFSVLLVLHAHFNIPLPKSTFSLTRQSLKKHILDFEKIKQMQIHSHSTQYPFPITRTAEKLATFCTSRSIYIRGERARGDRQVRGEEQGYP